MWSWYSAAGACYAYLSDVSEGDEFEEESSAFRKSRWFTRGWTLQELVAPRIVCFYNESWRLLGRKGAAFGDESLTTIVSQITRIPSDFLSHNRELSFASVAQKMSWAAGRMTTRKEDRAYSLLGIFNINMPLLYGEGEKAFKRLQLELVNESNEHTIFAWSAFGGVRYPRNDADDIGLLAPSPDNFIHCGDVRQYKSPSSSQHHTTNIGLSITLPIVLAPEFESSNLYLAILDCYRQDPNLGWDKDSLISIYLRSEESLKYSRVGLGSRSLTRRQRNWAQRTQIFIPLERSSGASSISASKSGVPVEKSSSQRFRINDSSVVNQSQNGVLLGNLGSELATSNQNTATLLTGRLVELRGGYFNRFMVNIRFWMGWLIQIFYGTLWGHDREYIGLQLSLYMITIIMQGMQQDPLTKFVFSSLGITLLTTMVNLAEDVLKNELRQESLLMLISTPFFGHKAQIMIILAALDRGEILIAQTSILGNIIFNMIFALGCCFLASGVRHSEHRINSRAAYIMSSLMAPALVALIIPATFCASLQLTVLKQDEKVLIFSRGAAIMILVLSTLAVRYDRRWIAWFFGVGQYQLLNGAENTIRATLVLSLILSWGYFIASGWSCAIHLVDSIISIVETGLISRKFAGFILLPVICRVGHFVLSIRVAYTHSMEIAIPTVLLNCLFVTFFLFPLTVIYGWINKQDINPAF